MEIKLDLYVIGKFLGKWTTRFVLAGSGFKLAHRGSSKLNKFASVHRINNSDPQAITDNVFNCLQYFD